MKTERASSESRRPAQAAMDLADLVSLVVSLGAPSREVDEVVEAMLGGDETSLTVSASSVISSRWLSAETPAYTAGGHALSVLAHRRGYRVSAAAGGTGYRAEAWVPGTAKRSCASARTEGGAGIAAIASLAIKETKLV